MRKSFATFAGMALFAFGLVLSLYLSTSLLGRAYSQNNPAGASGAPSSTGPGARPSTVPPTGPSATDAPPPSEGNSTNLSSATSDEMPVFQNPEGYSYDPTGRRDPFRPYGQSQTTSAPQTSNPDLPPRPAEPLQQYDVSQLKVVGIIWEVRNPKAMIKDPVGKLHLIQRQTKIGRNNGFVAAIREGEIVVIEPAVSENGLMTATTRVLTLTR